MLLHLSRRHVCSKRWRACTGSGELPGAFGTRAEDSWSSGGTERERVPPKDRAQMEASSPFAMVVIEAEQAFSCQSEAFPSANSVLRGAGPVAPQLARSQ
jgi:hypothetical protein